MLGTNNKVPIFYKVIPSIIMIGVLGLVGGGGECKWGASLTVKEININLCIGNMWDYQQWSRIFGYMQRDDNIKENGYEKGINGRVFIWNNSTYG